MSRERLEAGDVVEVVYEGCDAYGAIGLVVLIAGPPGLTTIQVDLFDGERRGFALRTSLKYLGPFKNPEEVLGLDYFF